MESEEVVELLKLKDDFVLHTKNLHRSSIEHYMILFLNNICIAQDKENKYLRQQIRILSDKIYNQNSGGI